MHGEYLPTEIQRELRGTYETKEGSATPTVDEIMQVLHDCPEDNGLDSWPRSSDLGIKETDHDEGVRPDDNDVSSRVFDWERDYVPEAP